MTTNIGKLAGAAAFNNQFNSKPPVTIGHDEKPDCPNPKTLAKALIQMATLGRSQIKNAGIENVYPSTPREKVHEIEREYNEGRNAKEYQKYMSIGEFKNQGGIITQNGAKISDKYGYKRPFNGTILRINPENGTKEYFKFNENGTIEVVAKITSLESGTSYKIDELSMPTSSSYVAHVESSEEIIKNDGCTMNSVIFDKYNIPITAKEETVYREIPQK